jgi:uncharacterized protein involved in response to NO
MPRSLLHSPRGETPAHPALLAKGFRPFFLLAAGYAALALPVWLVLFATAGDAVPYFGPMYWHAHEMVFGFAVAVIAGFLLTATSNWTSLETAVGPALGALVVLWLAGRVAMLTAHLLPAGLGAALDLAFLPALAIACGRPIARARNLRNLVFLPLLSGLWLCNLGTHLGALGVRPEWLRLGSLVGVDLVVLAIVLVGGRVIPMFTRNATGRAEIAGEPRLDRLALICVAAVALADALAANAQLLAMLCVAAGAATLLRTRRWGSRHAFREPLVWVLHVAHAFVPLGMLLRAASIWTRAVPSAAALHALTAGAIGVMTLGMMTRVGLGHTGRMLAVPRRIAAAFAAAIFGALLRVGAAFGPPSLYAPLVVLAGALWSAAFVVYLAEYARALASPRVDGRPG